MTRNKKPDGQLNLPLSQTPLPLELPQDKQRELEAALADLLWSAAVDSDPLAVQKRGDES